MGKRDMLPKVTETEVIEAEIVNDLPQEIQQKNEFEMAHMQARYALVQKVAEFLPLMIDLAKDIVALKKIKAESAVEIEKIQSKCDLLNAEAEKFVKIEQEVRATIATKGRQTVDILAELTRALQVVNASPEVQTALISAYDQAIRRVCVNDAPHG